MLILDTTTIKLQAVLSGAVATTELDIAVGYGDQTAGEYTKGRKLTATNGATPVDVMLAPGASTTRNGEFISVKNRDSAAATITFQFNDNGTVYKLWTATLDPGETFGFTHSAGPYCNDVNGNRKNGSVQDLSAYLTIIAAVAAYQPLDADLTAIAALSTTPYGRSLLALADAAALRTAAALGSMATQDASAVAITGGAITGMASPTASSDVATKSYVDGLVAGLKWKASVVAATTAALTLASDFENGDTIDGVTLATGNRILVKNQTSASENGIYTVNASGPPTRATDADSGTELISAAVFVQQGSTNADKAFVCTNDAITLGSTSITFTAFATVVGALIAANNLSDLTSASTARTNLGLGTAATTNATAYATAAQGSTADSAAQLAFKTIAVSGQSSVVADSATDTLTLVAGSGMTITTDASTDTVTFAASGGASFIAATGGTITTDGDYKVHKFTSSGTFTVTSGSGLAQVLIVGGAGGGLIAGGGGGGVLPLDLMLAAGAFDVVVGSGGAGSNSTGTNAGNGSPSSFDAYVALGGGGAVANSGTNPGYFGSGAGGSPVLGTGFIGFPGQGHNGGNAGNDPHPGGGGGGASANGTNGSGSTGGNGGAGLTSAITGSSQVYGSGAGGGVHNGGGTPGTSGTNAGAAADLATAGNGTANFGGGGGGTSSGSQGGNGGSGVVIVRYKFQ